MPFGLYERGTVLAPYRLLPIGDLPTGRESKPTRSAKAVPGGRNEGEAQALGVVEAEGTTLIALIIGKQAAGSL